MEEWVSKALNGEYTWFEKNKENIDSYVDEFGMTPIMYALIGKKGYDLDVILKIQKYDYKNKKNLLGHAPIDVFLSSIDLHQKLTNMLKASAESGDLVGIFNALNPVQTIAKMGIGTVANFFLGQAFKTEEKFFETNDKQIFLNKTADFHTKERRKRIEMFQTLGELIDVNGELKEQKDNVESNKETYILQYSEEATEKLLLLKKEKIRELKLNYEQSIEKGEFESSQEYNQRVEKLFLEAYPQYVFSDERSLITNEEAEHILCESEKKYEDELIEMGNKSQQNEKLLKEYLKRYELLWIYCFPEIDPVCETYNADENYFPVQWGRHETKLYIPLEYAKQLRSNQDSYVVEIEYNDSEIHEFKCKAKLKYVFEDTAFFSEEVTVNLYSSAKELTSAEENIMFAKDFLTGLLT